MKNKLVYKFIGKVLIAFSAVFILPCIVGIIYHENIINFIIPQLISLLIGLILSRLKTNNNRFHAKDGFLIVSITWIIISLIGALPFYLNNDLNYIDSLFETISGLTTTGATTIKNVEILNHNILFWRSLTHFLGGMGVLAFVMTIIPLASSDKSMHLLNAEMPGPTVGKLVPSLKKSLIYLYGIYIGLTILEFLFLLCSNLSIFESLLISLSTAGTGGFSYMNNSLADLSNLAKIIVALFMFLFGINFNLYYLLLIKNIKSALKSEELKVYLFIYISSVLFIIYNTISNFSNTKDVIINSIFNVSSAISSTGFTISDLNIYTTPVRILIIFLMLTSACAGSTCGGFKIARLMICIKSILRDLKKIIYPNRVENITIEKKVVSEEVVKSTNIFLFLYIILIVVIMFIVSFDKFDYETTLVSTVSAFANNGLTFNISDFSEFSNLSKITLSIGMLFGRLEIFPIISLFVDFKKR